MCMRVSIFIIWNRKSVSRDIWAVLHTEFNIFFASRLKQHKLLTTDAFMYSSGAFIDLTTVYVRNATLPAFKHAKFFFSGKEKRTCALLWLPLLYKEYR